MDQPIKNPPKKLLFLILSWKYYTYFSSPFERTSHQSFFTFSKTNFLRTYPTSSFLHLPEKPIYYNFLYLCNEVNTFYFKFALNTRKNHSVVVDEKSFFFFFFAFYIFLYSTSFCFSFSGRFFCLQLLLLGLFLSYYYHQFCINSRKKIW